MTTAISQNRQSLANALDSIAALADANGVDSFAVRWLATACLSDIDPDSFARNFGMYLQTAPSCFDCIPSDLMVAAIDSMTRNESPQGMCAMWEMAAEICESDKRPNDAQDCRARAAEWSAIADLRNRAVASFFNDEPVKAAPIPLDSDPWGDDDDLPPAYDPPFVQGTEHLADVAAFFGISSDELQASLAAMFDAATQQDREMDELAAHLDSEWLSQEVSNAIDGAIPCGTPMLSEQKDESIRYVEAPKAPKRDNKRR